MDYKAESDYQKELMAKVFKANIDIMTDLALSISGKRWIYSDKELFHVTIIFMEVFMSHVWSKLEKEGLTFGEASEQAQLMGNELYEFVQKYTDINLKEVYKDEPEENSDEVITAGEENTAQ